MKVKGELSGRQLRVWQLNEGEPLPLDEHPRLMRAGLLMSHLAERGYDVSWWCSAFDHQTKTMRFDETTVVMAAPNERLVLLHSPFRYHKNISLSRILYLHSIARKFLKRAKKEPKPDVIISSYPSMSFSRAAVRYGRKNHVPVIIDVRDKWPDIFLRSFPEKMQRVGKVLLFPVELYARSILKKADAVTGVISTIVDWALEKAGRKAGPLDRYVYIGLDDSRRYSEEEMQDALRKWAEKGVTEKTWNACFYSTLSAVTIDYRPIFDGARELAARHPEFRLVICGKGDLEDTFRKMAENRPEIVMPGWCNDLEIKSLLSIGNTGIYPFRNQSMRNAISNKFVGYLAAGLPVLTSLEGLSKTYVEEHGIGAAYREGDAGSFVQAVEELMEHPEKTAEQGSRARACFEKDFDCSVVNAEYEKLIREVIGLRE